ncbi:MAG TPA: universal stress protein, partial [Chitinophagaceae bacterium]
QSQYKPIRNIVLAIDFYQQVDKQSMDPLIEIIKAYDASLRVIHVEKKAADFDASEMGSKLQMGSLLGKLSYIYDKLEDDDIDIGIENYIESHPADLLVMIEHHHNLMTRLFGTIHTTNMSHISKIPILIL